MQYMTVRLLQRIGLKVTPQRQALLELLNGNKTHPSAEDIYSKLVSKFPRISLKTVYNTLARLAEAGEIQELDIDPYRKRFDPNAAPHHHFYCKICGRVFDVAQGDSFLAGDLNLLDRADVNGHQIDTVQLNFKGVCKECKEKR
ncbi:MAG: Peroxide operon regulator [Syntrophorhabdus sp. PtaU1.Bin153]|nr:MAG: Peroxide operon regulator [Syntrophorhabdus sp. PtaU1.Bin153]